MQVTRAGQGRWVKGRGVSVLAAALLTAALFGASPAGISAARDKGAAAADPGVITKWNAVTVDVVNESGRPGPQAFLWYGFAHAAIYNAVNGITREYELYQWNRRGPAKASPEAAAAAAAHRLLSTYFPNSQARLDTALAESLSGIPDGPAEKQGISYGESAADRIVDLRAGDGRDDPTVVYDKAPAPGVWRPTPPANAPMLTPWLAEVRPMVLSSATRIRPPGPPALTSSEYATDFNEVKAVGAKNNSTRTPAQTETALFFSDISFGPLQAALRDVATRHELDISESARLFAATEMSLADTIITTWDAKLDFGFWRPITAIHEAANDGNARTAPQSDWEPFLVTPPYPEYSSGLASVVGSLSTTVSALIGNGRDVDLNITSAAAGAPGAPVTRHYERAAALNRDVIDARVWSGIHFRFADVDANILGAQVSRFALRHYFQPTG